MRARMWKETRQMMWPWLFVTLGGAVSLVQPEMRHGWAEWVLGSVFPVGAFVGLPLLATLVLGYELEYKTLPLLLTQPLRRQDTWREKQKVIALVVLAPLVFYGFAARTAGFGEAQSGIVAVAALIAMVLSATFWTMVGRGTIGGVALNCWAQLLFLFTAALLSQHVKGLERLTGTLAAAWAAVLLIYGVAMFWLGRRVFLRYQAVDGIAAEDGLSAITEWIVPRWAAEVFRARPRGAVANLVRREFRLLRVVWLLSGLELMTWISLFVFGFVPIRGQSDQLSVAAIMATCMSPLIAVLAGTISLGEEKTWGTHAWQMTLPLSRLKQWAIKLGMALFASLVGGVVVPVSVLLVVGAKHGSVYQYVSPLWLWLWPVAIAVVTTIAFWAASAVKGTVRASLWAVLALVSVPVTIELSAMLEAWERDALHGWLQWVVMRIGPFRLVGTGFLFGRWPYAVICGSMIGVVLWRSVRLFREEQGGSAGFVIRQWLPIAGAVFGCALVLGQVFNISIEAMQIRYRLLKDTNAAISRAISSGNLNAGAAALSVAELKKTGQLSATTLDLLGNGNVNVTFGQPKELKCCDAVRSMGDIAAGEASYTAEFQLADGRSCTMIFRASRPGGLTGSTHYFKGARVHGMLTSNCGNK